MSRILTDKIIKTRKEHPCNTCGNPILKGEQARHIVRGDFSYESIYICAKCDAVRDDVSQLVRAMFPERYPRAPMIAIKGTPDEHLERSRALRRQIEAERKAEKEAEDELS